MHLYAQRQETADAPWCSWLPGNKTPRTPVRTQKEQKDAEKALMKKTIEDTAHKAHLTAKAVAGIQSSMAQLSKDFGSIQPRVIKPDDASSSSETSTNTGASGSQKSTLPGHSVKSSYDVYMKETTQGGGFAPGQHPIQKWMETTTATLDRLVIVVAHFANAFVQTATPGPKKEGA